MNHEAIQERLSSYLDGDLTPDERAEIEAHLEGCDACREELELLRVTLDALHDLPELSAPAGFADAVMEKIPEGGTVVADGEQDEGAVVVPLRRKGPGALVWAPVAMAAAACLVVGVVWWQLPNLTGKGGTAADQAAPTMFAEMEEAEAPNQPAGSAAPGRWNEERAKAKGVESGPSADPSDLDGLVDSTVDELDDSRDTTGLSLESGARGAGGTGTTSRGFDENASGNDHGRMAEVQPPRDGANIPTPDAGGGERGVYYTEWERREATEGAAGDAVADLGYDGRGDNGLAPAPPSATTGAVAGGLLSDDGDDGVVDLGAGLGGARTSGASDKADEFGFGTVSGERYDDVGEVANREAERMRKEEEAYRRIYEDADDAVVDTATIMADEAEEEDGWDAAPEALAEEPMAMDYEADERSVSKSAAGGRDSKKGGLTRSRGDRDEDRGRAKDRSSPFRKQKAEAQQEQSYDDDTVMGSPSVGQSVTEAMPAEEKVAIAGSAEWTLQTTDSTAPYAVSEMCDELFSLRCTWGAPGHRPAALGAQDNYQVVELRLLGAEYASVQTRLRQLGSVLVRTEDIAMANASDPITVRLIIEYMP